MSFPRLAALTLAAAGLAATTAGCRLRSIGVSNDDALGTTDRPQATDSGSGGGQNDGALKPDRRSDGAGTDKAGGDGVGPGGCVPSPEACNGLDDDCDGITDNGFDLKNDPQNCSACNHVCKFTHATPLCQDGTCAMGDCVTGFFDANKDASDGCECVRSNGGVEICDGIDNDCNGVIDDGFDLTKDLKNCGTCGNACGFFNATAACTMGTCQMTACLPNFYDVDKDPKNGCEYACIKSGVEVCDGFDNDCNGVADDGMIKGVGDACGPMQAGTGECKPGKQACVKGVYVCMGSTFPSVELCDNKDNDCDGTTDNGFDKMNDPFHCGGCSPCPLGPHVAVAGCSGGKCNIAVCASGWTDTNGKADDGCENNCPASTPEVCDGVDNDCDGLTDAADPDLIYPSNFCIQVGECGKGPGGSSHYAEKTFPECKKVSGASSPDWYCNYPATVETIAPGLLAPDETLCDGKDNDCDMLTDETFPDKGTACFDAGIGACRRSGTMICTADQTGTVCNLPPGPAPSPGPELCNGADDDCDGVTDNISATSGYDDTFVLVNGTTTIFAYEASRPDATGASAGGLNGPRPCSVAGRLPWADVTKEEAAAACAAVGAGWRLCSSTEWEGACKGSGATTFPYGASYVGATCNGADYPDGRNAIPTGTASGCKSNWGSGLFDMSGNVREWALSGATSYELRGGAYSTLSFTVDGSTSAPGLQCDAKIAAPSTPIRLPTVGFRCCHTGAFP